ncbi:MAG: acyl-[ACP]--phospholipid O-acyltransferase [Motiliproteus sp.]
MKQLLRQSGFLPFILVVFINAFVDLGHKIIIQNTIFKIYDGQTQILLTAIVNGLILLPFILLFSPAGFLSDRFAKPRVIRASAFAAVLITLMITLSYYQGWFEVAFFMTFLLAIQSALYSPAKYGLIKELAGTERLATANALVQAVTIIAILAGVFAFSILFEGFLLNSADKESEILLQIAPIGWVLVLLTTLELALAIRLCNTKAIRTRAQSQQENPENFQWQRYLSGRSLQSNLKLLNSNSVIWLSIIGLSVFWGISQVVLAAFPAYAKETLAMDNTIIVQGLLACSGIGIVIGSALAGKASQHHIETGLIPLGAIGIVISLLLLPQFEHSLLLALCFIGLGLSGGLFIVPLNALIQFHAPNRQLGTILAGNNWIQNLVMLAFLALTLVFAYSGTNSLGLFYLLGLTAIIGTAYTLYRLPQSLLRLVISYLFAGRYRIEVMGFKHLPSQGPVLMLGNHISWLDWAMVQIASPRPVRFVMHRDIYQRWYLKWLMDLFGVIPIAGGNSKASLEKINQLLKAGEVVCLFPEGAISRNGQLGEFKRGYERCVENVDGIILPFYLRGLWGSRFSRSSERLQQLRSSGLRRDIIVAFGAPLPISTTTPELKQNVFNLSMTAWKEHTRQLDRIPEAWIKTVKRQGQDLCVADAKGGMSLSGYNTLTAAVAFSRLIKRQCPGRNVGMLMPTSSAGLITNMASLIAGKTLVNLNYSASLKALSAAVEKAEINTIVTSRKFVSRLAQRGVDIEPLLCNSQVLFAEDLAKEVTTVSKILILATIRILPASWLCKLFCSAWQAEQPAAILFSSGSEGEPKGIMLSHENIMGNIKQVSDVLDTQADDRIMATLPLFHAFGLTVTGLMPLIEGMPVICHPDPTDCQNIAKAIAHHRATIFCATSTFLRLFNRNSRIHPLMLDSLRIVVAGAERMDAEVREAFQLKYNKTIYEGYGTTETTPVASVNIPDRLDDSDWHIQQGSKLGTVGLPLPGSSFRVVDPNTLETLDSDKDGLILIGGSQVMMGYLNDPEKTMSVIIELDGQRWYSTGDKGHLDADGFLTIVDRYSRFAKIAGEMISLGAVEMALNKVIDESGEIVATAIPDGKKGEQVILLYSGTASEEELFATVKASELPPLMRPSSILKVEEIPKLGSGKNDFSTAKKLAMELT